MIRDFILFNLFSLSNEAMGLWVWQLWLVYIVLILGIVLVHWPLKLLYLENTGSPKTAKILVRVSAVAWAIALFFSIFNPLSFYSAIAALAPILIAIIITLFELILSYTVLKDKYK
ncbi:MAG: hypothetical protein ACPLW6_07410 [Desulfurella sp.]|jgi:hypothetical protein|uniref:hypothetical protein n=1 Tax=Desulfurella TaxID=33001 RepID=UPI000CC9237F|nr:hypothetical protein [Desulfurella multipotens]PMP68447.1 MAG: hypothetical protein C0192_01845 [Desulfurella multipotens]